MSICDILSEWRHVGLISDEQEEQALAALDKTPTVDVVEIRRGEWTSKRTLEHDGEYYCSVCGYWDTEAAVPNYNFCPNCGAKMSTN